MDLQAELWAQATRAPDLQTLLMRSLKSISGRVSFARLAILRYVPGDEKVELIADTEGADGSGPLSRRAWTALSRAAGKGVCVRQTFGSLNRRVSGILGVGRSDAAALLAVLHDSSNGFGVALVALARDGAALGERHLTIANSLLGPMGAAVDLHAQFQELTELRRSAEADRQSLLTRLGRSSLNDEVVGAETGLKPAMDRVEQVARADLPVLLLGETGSGKEVLARRIHERSARGEKPFIRVNCGAIAPELVDSELFGHERGSFTGATDMRRGWFEQADGGSLFLDEVGELPLSVQVRLLRVLQDGQVMRVGGERPAAVDVRIIAATNQDLHAMVDDGRFREDLWYRLAVFPIRIPPLRERREDIAALATHFAQKAARRFGLNVPAPSEEDVLLLQGYHWPGNARELQSVMDRAVILGNGRGLEVAVSLGTEPRGRTSAAVEVTRGTDEIVSEDRIATLDDITRRHIERALKVCKGRVGGTQGAAQVLGINPHTLRGRMRKLGIRWSGYRKAEPAA